MVRLLQTDPHHPAAGPLLAATDGELTAGEAADLLPPRGVLLLLVEDGETIAGGALAPLRNDVAEVKRMWTGAPHRRQGYARHVLAALELEAVVLGYRRIRLKTDTDHAPALALYADAGYRRFGRNHERVGFEKRLA